METGTDRTEALCKKLALKNVKMKKHFIRKKKKHEMKTRDTEQFEVNFAHTE